MGRTKLTYYGASQPDLLWGEAGLCYIGRAKLNPYYHGSPQLPLLLPRSDARQNLIDSITCATAYSSAPYVQLHELALCFGGKLLRGNRCAPAPAPVGRFTLGLVDSSTRR